jgi:lauroyl/myristoyl acyltransferase
MLPRPDKPFVPRAYLGKHPVDFVRSAYYQYGLVTAAHVLGFEPTARIARRAGRFLWKHIPLMNRGIQDTVAAALAETRSPEEIDEIACRFTTDFWLFFLETEFIHRKITRNTWPRYVRTHNADRLIEAVRGGRGVVGVSAYFGNHQVGMTALGCMLDGKVAGIVSPLQFMTQQRWMAGLVRRRLARLYPRGDAMNNSIRALRDGSLILLIAEHLSKGRHAVEVEYLGAVQPFHPSAALLAWRTRSPLAVVTCCRLDEPFRFELAVRDWIEPPSNGGRQWVRDATVRAIRALDQAIRERPAQYAWSGRQLLAGPAAEGTG